jgi:hypothetical protein
MKRNGDDLLLLYQLCSWAGISNPQKIEVGKLQFKNSDKLIHLFVAYNEAFVSEKMIFKWGMFQCHDSQNLPSQRVQQEQRPCDDA